MRADDLSPKLRIAKLEAVERRLLLSAQPVVDIFLDDLLIDDVEHHDHDVTTTLSDVHQWAGTTYVHDTYGFTGDGQTVAVIDSGIAYDHYALGGGLGEGYRVVGGWDFTEENDANPYDDGPAGYHGTHVAGIIASDDATYSGVATDVDLVALRVFNDMGVGEFAWVENALQWVHDNRDAFENPITTVNLSLGTNWNADTVPNWAMLENEFAQLEADGIFISVSAGNSFSSYNATGLSYPAASEFVVPVASLDDADTLSGFSQRNSRVIAAPGRSITSTVPDHLFDFNGVTDDFVSLSGTSMAAPYVAGASVLVREAMELAGYESITQDVIYDHLRDTADMFYDPATAQSYHALNLQSALDAILVDDYGTTAATALQMGSLSDTATIDGMISQLDDTDGFQFTAAASGTVTFSATTTHDVFAQWSHSGIYGSVSGNVGDELSFDVLAGQTYLVSLESTNGLGYYNIDVTLDSEFQLTDWGAVDYLRTTDLDANIHGWYRFAAERDGVVTVAAEFSASSGDVQIDVYDQNLNLVDTIKSSDGSLQLNRAAAKGEVLYLKLSGANSSVDVVVANQVGISGGQVEFIGSDANDNFGITMGSIHHVTFNGMDYDFSTNEVDSLVFHGGGGHDVATIYGTSNAEHVVIDADGAIVSGEDLVSIFDAESILVHSGGGDDTLRFEDSKFDDHVVLSNAMSSMTRIGVAYSASGFSDIDAVSTNGGNDTLEMFDTSSRETFRANATSVSLKSSEISFEGSGFQTVAAHATSGNDTAYLVGTAGNDSYTGTATSAVLTTASQQFATDGFAVVMVSSNGGLDVAQLYGSEGNDTASLSSIDARLYGKGYFHSLQNFSEVTIDASQGGYDLAYVRDSAGNDLFVAGHDVARMSGDGYANEVRDFEVVQALATTGHDVAELRDTDGNDVFYGGDRPNAMSGSGYYNQATGFDQVTAFASGGYDIAMMDGSVGDDVYVGAATYGQLDTPDVVTRAEGFDSVSIRPGKLGGHDVAYLFDSAGADVFSTSLHSAELYGDGFHNTVAGFDDVYAYATSNGAYDQAILVDTPLDDLFTSEGNIGMLRNASGITQVEDFVVVSVYSRNGGADVAEFHDTAGNDVFSASPTQATMSGVGYSNRAYNFNETLATSQRGNDAAMLYSSLQDDFFTATSTESLLAGNGFSNRVTGFASVRAFANQRSGTHTATLAGSLGDDNFLGWAGYGKMTGDDFQVQVQGFEQVDVSGGGGNDRATLLNVRSDQTVTGTGNVARLITAEYLTQLWNFENLTARARIGEQATAEMEAIDYVFDQIGDWDS